MMGIGNLLHVLGLPLRVQRFSGMSLLNKNHLIRFSHLPHVLHDVVS